MNATARRARRGQKAWLVTWNWNGEHAVVEDRIAAILRPRLSKPVVGEIVECLYAIHQYTPGELAYWSRRPRENPYKAHWEHGYCHCGHNPWLEAHYVHDLVIEEDPSTGHETLRWVLPPRYSYNYETRQREQVRGELSESTIRTRTGPLSDQEIGRRRTAF